MASRTLPSNSGLAAMYFSFGPRPQEWVMNKLIKALEIDPIYFEHNGQLNSILEYILVKQVNFVLTFEIGCDDSVAYINLCEAFPGPFVPNFGKSFSALQQKIEILDKNLGTTLTELIEATPEPLYYEDLTFILSPD